MKKLLSVVLAVAMLFTCCACGGENGAKNDSKNESKTEKNEKFTIGICQLAPHPALDAATNGFKRAVTEKLGEENVEFVLKNAAGEANTCVTIANDFVSKNVDLIMANATAALQAAANATTEIPILGTSITEYGVALEIKDFNGTVGGNISGTSDLAPLDKQAQMILDLVPTAKKVGILYCSAEPNSVYQAEVVKKYLEAKNISVEIYKFSDSNDVTTVATAAAAASDAIYIPTDNKAAECAQTINNAVLPTKTPIIAGEAGICSGCGIATLSISYDELGYATGLMAVKILKGESKIEEMPIEYYENPKAQYNEEICNELGIKVPDNYEKLS